MQCSELFSDVFDSNCGGIVRTCECGITHFDTYNIHDYEDGELEELQRNAQKDPKHYISHDHPIGTMEISGIEIVYNCSCELAKRYENFIISHAEQIAEYLNKRATILREKAELIGVKIQPANPPDSKRRAGD